MNDVTFDPRAVVYGGRRQLILSGAIHYPRSTPAMWPELLRRSSLAGLNTIETYVFWNLHERQRGVFDFSDRLDLRAFCTAAQALGLKVILRIGPYICAETNYGGLPPWLRDVSGMQMRTYNEPFLREMERWVRLLCDYLRPMFAPQGGPVILAQIENEYNNVAGNYGEAGQKYLEWCVKLSQSLELGVPWVMCVGSAPGAIETINAFYGHEHIEQHRRKHPDQPALWTEAWTGWYDTWGYAHHRRSPEDMAYGAARFFAAGGTGINYYMWHGGTNFGRESMYLQTTSYDFSAPLDEFGLETTKSNHLARLHEVLCDSRSLLLSARPEPVGLGDKQVAYVYGDAPGARIGGEPLVFLCNDDSESPARVRYDGKAYPLAPRSVQILRGDLLQFDSARVRPESVVIRWFEPAKIDLAFEAWPEPMPTRWPAELQSATVSDHPVEQLQFTRDRTDYCWYTTTLVTGPNNTQGRLLLELCGDLVHVFVDGRRVASTTGPLAEDRGRPDTLAYRQAFDLDLPVGEHELSILCCALGLIKGDWMLGQANMACERKGLWGYVRWNGQVLEGWRIQPGLVGEACGAFHAGGAMLPWQAVAGDVAGPCWLRATFDRPAEEGVPLALDLAGMNKGLIWLNGRCAGRYWLQRATAETPDWLRKHVQDERAGEPTQRHYHLPAEWLARSNTLVLLEEVGGQPGTIRLCRWR